MGFHLSHEGITSLNDPGEPSLTIVGELGSGPAR